MNKVVLFDLDRTLSDLGASQSAAVQRWSEQIPELSLVQFDELERFYATHARRLWDAVFQGLIAWNDARHELMRMVFQELAGVSLAKEQLDYFHDLYDAILEEQWRLFDDVLPCLVQLRDANFKLGIVTNGDESFQIRKLKALNIFHFFDFVVTAKIGFAKPQPEIFHHAAFLANVDPGDCVFIGDCPVNDAQGSLNAGMWCVGLARYGEHEKFPVHEKLVIATSLHCVPWLISDVLS